MFALNYFWKISFYPIYICITNYNSTKFLPALHLIQRLFSPRIGSLVSGLTRIKVTG